MYNDKYLQVDWRTAPKRGIRDGVGTGLLVVGDDEKVIVLDGDVGGSTRAAKFEEKYPDRYFEVGVAEQNLAGLASGLASEGFIPFISSYASFSPGRNWEQIRISIALSSQNVKIIGGHGGVATGLNGPSHQATEDIALMRVLPNMTVIVPADATQCGAAIEAAYHHSGPVYIRSARPDVPDFTKEMPFVIGQAYVYREGTDVTICASGMQVWDALVVAEQLEKDGISCEVINVSTIKPLDSTTIIDSLRKTGKVVTIEDHQIAGGMGSAVAEVLGEQCPVPIKRMGMNDTFGMSGDWEAVYAEFGLDRPTLYPTISTFVR